MDRKAWIILTLCGILLALNFYYKPEPPKPMPVETDSTEVDSANTPSSTTDFGDTSVVAPKGKAGMIAEPPVESVGDNIETLTTRNEDGEKVVEFAITSRGGGIKTATMLNQFAVGSKTEKVVLNQHAQAPIGAVCDGPGDFLALDYNLVKDGDSIYCEVTTSDGLKITKKWALKEDRTKPGAPWQINLTITIINKGQGNAKLSNYSLFSGSAAPLHPREWENQGGVLVFPFTWVQRGRRS